MTWFLIAYAVIGLLVMLRFVPWGERTYFFARFKSLTWQGRVFGIFGLALYFPLFWPFELYVRWRPLPDPPADDDAAEAAEQEFHDLRQAFDDLGKGPLLLLLLLLLPACTFLEEAARSPEVVQAVAKVGGQVIAGEWYGAAYAVVAAVTGMAGKWLHGRLKTSQPGEVIG